MSLTRYHNTYTKEFINFLLLGHYATVPRGVCLHFIGGNCPCQCFQLYLAIGFSF